MILVHRCSLTDMVRVFRPLHCWLCPSCSCLDYVRLFSGKSCLTSFILFRVVACKNYCHISVEKRQEGPVEGVVAQGIIKGWRSKRLNIGR